MQTIVDAVFPSRDAAARAAAAVRAAGVPADHVNLIAPGDAPTESSPESARESTGIGAAIGGVLGASALIATGFEAGALASFFVPGVGPVVATGLAVVAILGIGGAAAGAPIGAAAEAAFRSGDERAVFFFHYQECLRRGRSIVVVAAADAEQATRARAALDAAEGATLERVREEWWAERGPTAASPAYRQGFEAAQKPDVPLDGAPEPPATSDTDYRRGFLEGLAYRQRFVRDYRPGVPPPS